MTASWSAGEMPICLPIQQPAAPYVEAGGIARKKIERLLVQPTQRRIHQDKGNCVIPETGALIRLVKKQTGTIWVLVLDDASKKFKRPGQRADKKNK